MMQGVERQIKQCLVDKEPVVQSAALLTCLHFNAINGEVVRRWTPEIASTISSQSAPIVQYHGTLMMYALKQGDKMALVKLVKDTLASTLAHPLTTTLVIRVYAQLLGMGIAPFIDLRQFLRSKNDSVILEAARVIVECNCGREGGVKQHAQDVSQATTALIGLMLGGKATSVSKFAVLKTISMLAMHQPSLVTPYNQDLERLIQSSNVNKSVSTMAITTLLKTGTETSIDGLLAKIADHITASVSDEFKVMVVKAVRALCLKFPSRHHPIIDFLGRSLRDEGGREYKEQVLDALMELAATIPACHDPVLAHLCEFIEDSPDYPDLTAETVYFLGEQAGHPSITPSTMNLIIRCLYNRLILDGPLVRMAVVSALGRVACSIQDPSHRALVMNILEGLSQRDSNDDDELRDKAAVVHAIIASNPQAQAKQMLFPDKFYDLDALEAKLLECVNEGEDAGFDVNDVPLIPIESMFKMKRVEEAAITAPSQPQVQEETEMTHEEVIQLPETIKLPEGSQLFKLSPLLPLTDTDTEYPVHARKHIYTTTTNPHKLVVVIEFECQNTVPSQVLRQVKVDVRPPMYDQMIEIDKDLPCNASASAYAVVEHDIGSPAHLDCVLRMIVMEEGQQTREQYPIAPIDIDTSDYFKARPIDASDWDKLPSHAQDTFTLTALSSINTAIHELLTLLQGAPLSNSHLTESKQRHMLELSGTLIPDKPFIARCTLTNTSAGIVLDMEVRSTDPSAAQCIVNVIA
jgi:coatomer subunit gamma